jgi:outer membrane protein assembly factor BamB
MFGTPIPPTTYTIQNTTIYGPALVMYNLTKAIRQPSGLGWSISPGTVYQWPDGIEWVTQSIPPVVQDTITGQDIVTAGLGQTSFGFSEWSDGVLIMTVGAIPVRQSIGWEVAAGFSATGGQMLWITNRTGGVHIPYTRLSSYHSATIGVYAEINLVTLDMAAYSIQTGKQVWTSTLNKPMADGHLPNPYDVFYIDTIPDTSTGILYVWGFGGDVWAVNMTNGNIIWSWRTIQANGPAGTETPYGIYPLWIWTGSGVLAGSGSDKMLYLPEGHMYNPPLFHGARHVALNATTGELVWDILGFDCTATAVAYGIMTTFNAYDGQLYGYGRGPSKTTASTPTPVTTVGSPIVIQGTVTDVSAGSQQEAVAANFPNGLPAVSDASMTQFMEAVYEQQPMPANVTGVPVIISVTDSNNNYYNIGTTTTSPTGTFGLTWTPDIPGNFLVTATFAGTQSYYGSSATTYFYASDAPVATPEPTQAPASLADQYFMPMSIGIIAAIAIVGIVLALLLRKR